MPDFKLIYELVKRGEDTTLDFKKQITDLSKIARTIVSFANTKGGQIAVGINDEGEITGIDVNQERFMLIKAGRHYCDPAVFLHFSTLKARGRQVLLAEIKKGKHQNHLAKNDYGRWIPYVRVADESIVSPAFEFEDIDDKHNRNPIPILLEQNTGLVNYLEEYESISVKEYMQIMNISYNTATRSLKGLVENGVLEEENINHVSHYFLKDSIGLI